MSEKKYSPEEVEKIKTRILESLEQVIDPELGIDIGVKNTVATPINQ